MKKEDDMDGVMSKCRQESEWETENIIMFFYLSYE